MKRFLTLRLLPDGDIEIVEEKRAEFGLFGYEQRVYHKSFDMGEDIKDNLMKAYEEWKRLGEGK